MAVYIMTEAEQKLADILWEAAPISSGQVVTLCRERLGWQKSTTYTVLRKLCQEGICQNQDATVSMCMSKDTYTCKKGERYLEENYQGSLPSFVAAYLESGRLTLQEVEELQALISEYQREE